MSKVPTEETETGSATDDALTRHRVIDVEPLFASFLEEDDPQTMHMVLFRVAEIVLNRSPDRHTQDLLKMLTKAGDSASRARLELDPDLASEHEHRFQARKVRAYHLAALVQEI